MAKRSDRVYCVNIGFVGALVFFLPFLLMFNSSNVSEGVVRIVYLCSAIAALFTVLSSVSILTPTSIRFLSPIRPTWIVEHVEELIILPINGLGDGKQLGIRVGKKTHRVPNVTSRNINDRLLSDFSPELRRWWFEGGDAPTTRYWLCR